MADFTDRLPLTDGTNRVIDDPAGPSIVTPILQTLSGGLESYVNYRETVAADKEKAKKEAEKKRTTDAQAGVIGALYGAQDSVADAAAGRAVAEQAVSALDQDLRPLQPFNLEEMGIDEKTGAVFGTGIQTTINPVVEKRTTQAIGDITNFMAAVDQGRMPPISLKSAINGRLRKLFEEYPDQAENILDMINKTEAKDVVFAEIGDVVAEINGARTSAQNQREDDRQFTQAMFEAGMKGLGELAATGGANGGPMTREEVVAAGLRYARTAQELDLVERQSRIAASNAALSESERKVAEETNQDEIVRLIDGDLYNDSVPVIRMAQQVAAAMATDPTGADAGRWEQLGIMANNAATNWVEKAVALAVQKGYKGDIGTLRNNWNARFRGMLDNFTGDKSVAAANHRALGTMQDKLGINVQQALPVFMSLKAAGLKPDEMPALMEGISRNPEMQKRLQQEIQGFVPDFGAERSSTRLMNIIKILRGEQTLRALSPGEARSALTTLLPASRELAKGYVRGLGVGPDALLNSVGEAAIATRTLSPSSGANAHRIAAGALGNADMRAALIKVAKDGGADQTMVNATIQAVRAGDAQVLNNFNVNMTKINQQHGQYYQIKWDNANGRFVLDDSKKRAALAQAKKGAPVRMTGEDARFARMGGGMAEANIRNAAPPEEMQKWLNSANSSLDNITALAPYDETAPKANALELRRFYGRGIPLKSMQNGDEAIVPSAERSKMFDTLESTLKGITPDAVDVPAAAGTGASDYARNPAYTKYAPIVQSTAQKFGIPQEILSALIQKESTFNPNARGPVIKSGTHKGDRAMGLGQVMAKTAAAYGITDRESLTPDQQIELAARVLSDNKKQGGSWKDALSRYFTGVDYKTAQRQGRTDGFNSVFQYVESIAD